MAGHASVRESFCSAEANPLGRFRSNQEAAGQRLLPRRSFSLRAGCAEFRLTSTPGFLHIVSHARVYARRQADVALEHHLQRVHPGPAGAADVVELVLDGARRGVQAALHLAALDARVLPPSVAADHPRDVTVELVGGHSLFGPTILN